MLRSEVEQNAVGAQTAAVAAGFDAPEGGIQRIFSLRHPPFQREPRRVLNIAAKGVQVLAATGSADGPTRLEGFAFLLVECLAPILAHRPTRKTLPHQDAAQIRVPVEADAVHIVGFALLELRAGEERDERGHMRVIARHQRMQHQGAASLSSEQVVDDFKFAIRQLVHAGHAR